MKERFNCIVEYLGRKKTQKFSGSVKLSFENGNAVAINEANRHELPVTPTNNGNAILDTLLNEAKKPMFNGAIIFVFETGNITAYAYSKSFKGETLKKFLGA